MADEVLLLARQYKLRQEAGPQHADWCDYLKRRPPRADDCDCGAYNTLTFDLEEVAEQLVEAVLARETVTNISEALRDH